MIKADELKMIIDCLDNEGRLPDIDLTKRQYSILQKWDRRGHWDFGVSLRTGWMTPEGKEYFIKLINDHVKRHIRKTLEKCIVRDDLQARSAVKMVLRFQDLTLEDNNDITHQGQVVAKFGSAKWTGDRLEYTIQPMKAIEFIVLDLKLNDLKTS